METKPFSLQSPEVIAKEYGGNKQKIGQAAQLGVIDPTAAVLAGMFIDRMRAAQVKEQVPQQTIAQQVFAPPAPPMPPMGGAPPPPPPPMPPMGGAPPVGMAAGGFIGPDGGGGNFGGGVGAGSGNFGNSNFGGGGGMSQQFTNQQPMNQQPMNQQFMSQQPMQPMGQQSTSPYPMPPMQPMGQQSTSPYPMPPMQPMGQQNSVNGYQGISAMTPRFADGGYVGSGSNFGGSNALGAYDDGGMVNSTADYGRGITALDLPDSMFEEPSSGGYANGGIVAFATGAVVGRKSFGESAAGRLFGFRTPEEQEAERQKNDADNERVRRLNLRKAAQMKNTFSNLIGGDIYKVPDEGVPLSGPEVAAAMAKAKAPAAVAAAPAAASAPVAPRPAPVAPRAPVRGLGAAARTLPPGAPGAVKKEEAVAAPAPAASTLDSAAADMRRIMGIDAPQPERDALRKAIGETGSAEDEKKFKHETLWTTLAQIGAGMASSKSPSFLQAAGDAMKEALPQLIASSKERKVELRQAVKDRAALEGMDRQEERELGKAVMESFQKSQSLLNDTLQLNEQGRHNKAAETLQAAQQAQTYSLGLAQLRVSAAAAGRGSEEERLMAAYKKDPVGFAAYFKAKQGGKGNLFDKNVDTSIFKGFSATPVGQ
tara:strand:+ start:2715 stop:4670 length:1956 start_codon:yes stop_codon:yes gene_type:complete